VAAATPATAAGTNIAVSASAALTAGATHARAGRVDWRIAAWMTGCPRLGRLSASTVRRSVGAALLAVSAAIGVAALF
jgi:uncharacterized membrane protein YfcA